MKVQNLDTLSNKELFAMSHFGCDLMISRELNSKDHAIVNDAVSQIQDQLDKNLGIVVIDGKVQR